LLVDRGLGEDLRSAAHESFNIERSRRCDFRDRKLLLSASQPALKFVALNGKSIEPLLYIFGPHFARNMKLPCSVTASSNFSELRLKVSNRTFENAGRSW
jgi:hypothetical protein